MKTTQFWMRLALYFILLVATGLMFFLPGGPHFQSLVTDTIHYERSKVTAVLSEQLEPSGIEPTQQLGQQLLEVTLQSGEIIELTNYLTDVHNVPVSEGQRVIVCVDAPENVEPYYTLYNFDRSGAVAGIVLIFIALMVLIGRRRGFDAALALLFSVLFLIRVTIPLIYNGASPVAVGLLTAFVATAVTILLMYGFHLRGIMAIGVTLAGECAACLFFLLFSHMLHISGFQTEEADGLLVVAQNTGLDIKQLLFAATMIAAVGAVMDMAVSLLSSLWEIQQTDPAVKPLQLLRSGFNIGRDMIGTMSNTLIFAFIGGALGTVLLLYSYGIQFHQLLNSDYIAVELAQGICGTVAVILSVPFSSLAAAAVFPKLQNSRRAPVLHKSNNQKR